MLVTPIHKKGDKMDPKNYRAIALLSIPGKVFCRILMNRSLDIIERSLSESQYGFRPGRGTTGAIFIARQIIEKAREHQVPLHFHFIDFKSAFDTIWREAMWKMLLKTGVPSKIVTIIKNIYEDTQCAIMIEGHITEWFQVNVGVRQGCNMSPILFNVMLDYVMKEVRSLDENFCMSADMSIDIRYADDTTLITTIFDKLKITTGELEKAC